MKLPTAEKKALEPAKFAPNLCKICSHTFMGVV